MDYNIINEYYRHFKNAYFEFYKILLKDDYSKKLIEPFLDKYIEVRYENETEYPRERDAVNRIGKELHQVYDELYTDEFDNVLKNIYSLFGYIVYFDHVIFVEDDSSLLDCFFNDATLRVPRDKETRAKITEWYQNLTKSNAAFFKCLDTKSFTLKEKRIRRSIYELTLDQNVRISNLYSEYAIHKAFTTGIVAEDTLYILYIKATETLLSNAIGLDFSRKYIVKFTPTLWNKEKKKNQLFNILNNTLSKKYLLLRITHQEYMENKDQINHLIHDGYSFALEIDETYDGDFKTLFLFPIIFVYEDSEFFDMIVDNRDKLESKIVKL